MLFMSLPETVTYYLKQTHTTNRWDTVRDNRDFHARLKWLSVIFQTLPLKYNFGLMTSVLGTLFPCTLAHIHLKINTN